MNTSKTNGQIVYEAFNENRSQWKDKWHECTFKAQWEYAAKEILEHVHPLTPGQAACNTYWELRDLVSNWEHLNDGDKELWEKVAASAQVQYRKLGENNG